MIDFLIIIGWEGDNYLPYIYHNRWEESLCLSILK